MSHNFSQYPVNVLLQNYADRSGMSIVAVLNENRAADKR